MLTISVQAGGQSRRMGRDKALIPFLGQTLIERVIARVRPAASEIIIGANELAPLQFLGLPVYPDRIFGKGVLGGLHTALCTARHPYLAMIACDMPFASAALLSYQLELIQQSGADVVIPQSSLGLEPLHAVYRCATCLPLVEDVLLQGRLRMTSWFEHAMVRVLEEAETRAIDPGGNTFANLNTPEELAWAETLARQESR